MMKIYTTMLLLALAHTVCLAQESYMLPPAEIIELVDAPATPSISIAPNHSAIAFIENRGLPALEDIAREELRLAGMRIDPMTNGPSRASYGIGITLTDINGENEKKVSGLPDSPRIRNLRWSPDALHIAFTHTAENEIQLWVLNIMDGQAKKINGMPVNDVMGNAFSWSSDNQTIFYTAVSENREELPERPRVAQAPVSQESLGRKSAVRTYQDLLGNRHDELLFEHYATSQIVRVDLNGNATNIGKPGIIWYFSPSPDSQYLLVNRIEKPFSYIVPFSRFPQTMEVIDMQGNQVFLVAEVPVSDNLPQGFSATREGPRSVQWRNDAPSTLFWVEALDGGDPSKMVEFRDQVFFLKAPFTDEPTASVKTSLALFGHHLGVG
jgi:dipeptidyl aminopeptidase/acylaminoacyl peptidase